MIAVSETGLLPYLAKLAARCSLCNTDFDISNMGTAAVMSHMKGAKHSRVAQLRSTSPMGQFVVAQTPAASSATAAAADDRPAATLDSFVATDAVHSAEAYWVMNVVDKNYSFKSCSAIGDLFQAMFPDSGIAQKFSVSERKCSYVSAFGIAPHFSSLLKSRVRSAANYVVLFDESHNDELQEKQMDMHVRLWGAGKVSTRYYDSVFLGHANADILQEALSNCCESVGKRGILQVSMDGPNVNWKAYDQLHEEIADDVHHGLIDIGSCGLHILHNAFRKGAVESTWNIESALSSLYWLFHDLPARREDFVAETDATVFPKRFCPHRWVENVCVAECALQLWPAVQQYVQAVQEGRLPKPTNKSFETVQRCTMDVLFCTKLQIFISIANPVEEFLTVYQTDRPMVPFISQDLTQMCKSLMGRFLKQSVMDGLRTTTKLLRLTLSDTSLHCDTTTVDVGFSADKQLRELKRQKKIRDADLLAIRCDTKQFIIALLKKFLEKTPWFGRWCG